ncbi:hypothetical protein LTR41_011938, partial [Exophiala xenobiotica]
MSYASGSVVDDGNADALTMGTQSEDHLRPFTTPQVGPYNSFLPCTHLGYIQTSVFSSFLRVPAAPLQQHRHFLATSSPVAAADQLSAGDGSAYNRHPSASSPFGTFRYRYLPVPPGYPISLLPPQQIATYDHEFSRTEAATRCIVVPRRQMPNTFHRIEERERRSTRSDTPPPLESAFWIDATAFETGRPSPRFERCLDVPSSPCLDIYESHRQKSGTQGKSLQQGPYASQSTSPLTFTWRTRGSWELFSERRWDQCFGEKPFSTEAGMINHSDDSAPSTASGLPRQLWDDLAASPPFARMDRLLNTAGQHAQAQPAFHLHRKSPLLNPNPRFSCTACMEDMTLDDLLNIDCGCRYCQRCLNAAFEAGCANMASFPPKCCGKPLRISVWGGMLQPFIVIRYKQIEAEFTENRPLYCAHARCSAFLPENDHLAGDELGVCFTCQTLTCKRCRRPMEEHQGVWDAERRVCPKEDDNVAALYALGAERRWKQCPRCMIMVERTEGCNHMDCICGAEFCYRCGQLFDEDDVCDCDLGSSQEDDEDEEIEHEDEYESDGEDWPNFRHAVDPAGRPTCFHRYTQSLGEESACHGCLEEKPLH